MKPGMLCDFLLNPSTKRKFSMYIFYSQGKYLRVIINKILLTNIQRKLSSDFKKHSSDDIVTVIELPIKFPHLSDYQL